MAKKEKKTKVSKEEAKNTKGGLTAPIGGGNPPTIRKVV